MKKSALTIILSLIIIFIGLYCGNKNPEYIWIKHPRELKKIHGKIDCIDINRVGNRKFNYDNRDFLGLEGYPVSFFPACTKNRILIIIADIGVAREYDNLNEPANFLIFETGNPITGKKIYCLKIDWNNETVYGEGWESKYLFHRINDWKEDNERMMKRARQRITD